MKKLLSYIYTVLILGVYSFIVYRVIGNDNLLTLILTLGLAIVINLILYNVYYNKKDKMILIRFNKLSIIYLVIIILLNLFNIFLLNLIVGLVLFITNIFLGVLIVRNEQINIKIINKYKEASENHRKY